MDKYDKQIKELTKHPERIDDEWSGAKGLFDWCGKLGGYSYDIGCLVMVQSGKYEAATPKLTKAIRADKRLPKTNDRITIKSLPVFAEWQRKIDLMGVR